MRWLSFSSFNSISDTLRFEISSGNPIVKIVNAIHIMRIMLNKPLIYKGISRL
nr:hypothetical protein [Providencia rettgeri]